MPLASGAPTCASTEIISTYADQVYSGLPYISGERAEYAVSYMGILAGTARLEVRFPVLQDGLWHQVYAADAQTGKWYRLIFVGHDSILSYAYPPLGIAANFTLDQDEGRLLGTRLHKHTEIRFDHQKCTANEKIEERGQAPQTKQIEINAGVMDTLSAAFKLRTFDYQLGKSVRFPVYSSGKSWWLEAEPLAQESIKVAAGVFSTIKLRLHTYLGDALQQKGELLVWIANDRWERPLVQVKAEVKIGSLLLQLSAFHPGKIEK